ncbi:hypothetical protein SASPL_145429 [Salvia splendens]|uniref:Protein kinase domain-containing protein n=1 Tax=Salvia splendens TaxID=180675 RepID=A0A8X8WIV7_SALSN|nr:hypothetical protein SASPL_145429 [Salvia splendens]
MRGPQNLSHPSSWDRHGLLGFAEGKPTRGLHPVAQPGVSTWDSLGMAGDSQRGRSRSAWDNPGDRSDYRAERHMPGGDSAWGRHDGPAGFYGAPNVLPQLPQQSLLWPPLGMSIAPPMQQMQFPGFNSSLPPAASSLPSSSLPDQHASFIPNSTTSSSLPSSSFHASTLSLNLLPMQPVSSSSEIMTNLLTNKAPVSTIPSSMPSDAAAWIGEGNRRVSCSPCRDQADCVGARQMVPQSRDFFINHHGHAPPPLPPPRLSQPHPPLLHRRRFHRHVQAPLLPLPAPRGWSSSPHFCTWNNVQCDSTNSFVTTINLNSAAVSGTLPPEINTLSHRQSLELQKNSLTDALPSFQNMTSLHQLLLDTNNFASFPNNLLAGLTNLQVFTINGNSNLASWQFPAYLSGSSNLVKFYASNASINGAIPDIFNYLLNLQDFRLSYNNLTGSLPESYSGSEIRNLWLNNQELGLSGTNDVLRYASAGLDDYMYMEKRIPDLSKCTNLFDLQLRDNRFTGLVLPSLINLPALFNITLQNNKLQGRFPEFPDSVQTNLVANTNSFCLDHPGQCDPHVSTLLDVASALGYPVVMAEEWKGNDACQDWQFILCDSQGGNVTVVNLGKQGFSGTISPVFANLTSLRTLVLSDNMLTGGIPAVLTTFIQLQTFDVSNNNLTGPILTFPHNVSFTYAGNAFLGKSDSRGGGPSQSDGGSGSSNKSPSVGMVVGVVIDVLVFVGIVLFVSYKCYLKGWDKRSRVIEGSEQEKEKATRSGVNRNAGVSNETMSVNSGDHSKMLVLEGGNIAFSIQILRQVTDNFSEENILGRGGFGVVYRGELPNGTKIAVKRMESNAIYGYKRNEGVSGRNRSPNQSSSQTSGRAVRLLY